MVSCSSTFILSSHIWVSIITVEFPLSTAKIQYQFSFVNSSMLFFLISLSDGCFVLLNMLPTMPLNSLASFSSSLPATDYTAEALCSSSIRCGTIAKFKPRLSRVSEYVEKLTTHFLSFLSCLFSIVVLNFAICFSFASLNVLFAHFLLLSKTVNSYMITFKPTCQVYFSFFLSKPSFLSLVDPIRSWWNYHPALSAMQNPLRVLIGGLICKLLGKSLNMR